MTMEIQRVALDDLKPDTRNARQHDQRNIEAIRKSLVGFGQVEPLVVQKSTGKVIGGNGRVEAMRLLGMDSADVVEVDVDDNQALALGLALNRTAELASWDFETLSGIFEDLKASDFALDKLGWDPDELATIMTAEWKPDAEAELPDRDDDGDGTESSPGFSITLTQAQRALFDRALADMRASHQDPTDGECVVLLVEEYFAHR